MKEKLKEKLKRRFEEIIFSFTGVVIAAFILWVILLAIVGLLVYVCGLSG